MHTNPLRLTAFALVIGLLAAAPLGAALAQDAAPNASNVATPQHAPDPHKQAQRLAHKLGLDAGQQAKLATILGDRQQQVAALRADTALSTRERRAKLRAIHQDSESRIQSLLSPAQQQQYAQLQQAIKARRQARQASAPAPAGSR